MKLCESQPAKTYDTNILSSALGRCYVDALSSKDCDDIVELSEASLNLLDLDKPVVPHTDPVLIRKFLTQLTRLQRLSGSDQVRSILGNTLSSDTNRTLQKLARDVTQIQADRKFLCHSTEIEAMFGMENLWDSTLTIAQEELDETGSQVSHPPMPVGLSIAVTQVETRKLMELVIREIFQIETPVSLTDSVPGDTAGHHLFWTTRENHVNYVTPAHYDLATQLSFDIPHNAAHIAHLAAHSNIGVSTFVDEMAQRGYFESVAVLSEHQLMSVLRKDPTRALNLYSAIEPWRNIDAEELMTWILADRIFESRLRVARLLTDHFTLEGLGFDEVVGEVSKRTQLSTEKTKSEAHKYYTHTGLGAMYVLGPKRLMKHGVLNPKNAIVGADGHVVRTWQEFNQQVA